MKVFVLEVSGALGEQYCRFLFCDSDAVHSAKWDGGVGLFDVEVDIDSFDDIVKCAADDGPRSDGGFIMTLSARASEVVFFEKGAGRICFDRDEVPDCVFEGEVGDLFLVTGAKMSMYDTHV